MGSLFSAMDIALSGLQASQIQLNVAGHNVANVNKEGYTRQRVSLAARTPLSRSYGQLGRGVEVQNIERLRADFIDTVYRQQTPGLGSAEVRASYFQRIEDLFSEPSDTGFGTRLSAFFSALSDFANSVEEQPVRMSAIVEAQSLATSLNQIAQQVYALRTNANEEVRNAVPEINSISEQIAALNVSIRRAEVGGNKANDLRDERDVLLDNLSKLVNISYSEQPDGQVDVFLSGDVLVSASDSRTLVAVRDPSLDPQRSDLVRIQFSDTGTEPDIVSGELYGALTARDSDLVQVASSIDTIAAAIVREVNKIQSTGNGLDNLSGTIAASNNVNDATATLDSAGLPFEVTPGSFDVIVYDSSGNPTTTTINITAATTLNSLVADLNAISNFSAAIGTDNALTLGATSPNTFSFANDSSGVLTALGVNGLFTGYSAATIGVNADIVANPRLLSSGYSTDLADTGDNTAAVDLANIQNALVLDNGTATIGNYYESLIVRVGVDARANQQTLDVQQSFVDDFQQRRLEVSGVSIDEEVTQMLLFQRCYEASARVITVADRMLDALLAMAQ